MTVFLKESNSDFDLYYMVENEKTAELLRNALDIEFGSPEEAEHYGGWDYNADIITAGAGYYTESAFAEMQALGNEGFAAKLVANGLEIGTEDVIKLILGQETDKKASEFCVGNISEIFDDYVTAD